jgi:hypothetical protein
MRYLLPGLFLFAAVVNLAPVLGALSAERLAALYGVQIQDPDLVLLMRHRALLFGIVGVLLVAAAFRPSLRLTALLAGLASMLSFIGLALSGGVSERLQRIATVDLVASFGLLVAAGLLFIGRDSRRGVRRVGE